MWEGWGKTTSSLYVSTGCRCETWEVVTSRVEQGAERTEKAARETADSLGSGQWHCTVYFAMGRIIHCSDLILRINDSQVGTFLNEVDMSFVLQWQANRSYLRSNLSLKIGSCRLVVSFDKPVLTLLSLVRRFGTSPSGSMRAQSSDPSSRRRARSETSLTINKRSSW